MAILQSYPAGPSRTSSVPTHKRSGFCTKTDSRQSDDMSTMAPTMWFPLNDSVSSSWPPKITFSSSRTTSVREKTPRFSHTSSESPDAMEGIVASHPKSARIAHARSATRAIPNRASRSNSLTVPATPTNLWRQVPDPKGGPHGLVGSDCLDAPIASGRIRPCPPLMDTESKAAPCPSMHDGLDARCGTILPARVPPTQPPHSSPPLIRPEDSVLTQWGQNQRTFLRLWGTQKRCNPRLPLIVSPLNPLRAFMPPLYWKSIPSQKAPFQKVEWKFTKPLPSPALRPRLRSRKECDAAAEHLSAKAIFSGKLRHHCRACNQDSLLKRLLLFNHWVARTDLIFESALSFIGADDDDDEMTDASADDSFPESVFLRDRHDFDDDDPTMDDEPLIVERHTETYALRLF